MSLSDPGRFKAEMEAAGFADVRIVPVTKHYPVRTPEEFRDDWHAASPVFTALLRAHPGKQAEIRQSLIDVVREDIGDGPGWVPQEALVGVAVKP